jgi:hypothetical protein
MKEEMIHTKRRGRKNRSRKEREVYEELKENEVVEKGRI